MSLQALEAARKRVAARKVAAGDIDLEPGAFKRRPDATEMRGVMVGTDLTVEELYAVCQYGKHAAQASIAAGATHDDALTMTFGEALLMGIEYGKALRK